MNVDKNFDVIVSLDKILHILSTTTLQRTVHIATT